MSELYLDFGAGYVAVVTTGLVDERDARREIVLGGAKGAQLRRDGAVLFECQRVGADRYAWRTATMGGSAIESIENADLRAGRHVPFGPSKVKR